MEKEEKKETKKLSYTELENAAKQISAQADALYKENQQLRQAIQNLSRQNVYAELNLMFKVVENKASFSSDFVVSIVEQIEKEMAIVDKASEEEKTADNTEEK